MAARAPCFDAVELLGWSDTKTLLSRGLVDLSASFAPFENRSQHLDGLDQV